MFAWLEGSQNLEQLMQFWRKNSEIEEDVIDEAPETEQNFEEP